MNAVEIEQVIIEQVETIKGKLDIADVEVQITIPTKMQITWFKLQFTFFTLISHLIVVVTSASFRTEILIFRIRICDVTLSSN